MFVSASRDDPLHCPCRAGAFATPVLHWAGMGTDAPRFCSRCGEPEPLSPRRVCPACGMGVLLSAGRGEEPPVPGAAFVVCTEGLRVSAVSEAAEIFLGPEEDVLGRPLVELVSNDEIARVGTCGPPRGSLVMLQKPLQDLRKAATAVRKR